ncbi:GSCOCG00012532001-RA-CDS [Cotesia congregata]|uniref:Protein Abitram n=1 Tax=Cotesia congregata TaxID=51543 RepID=A0A8J2EDQ4_COTCN|nr:GSCOCG00012532001-RA-CDS [Cotesia congregata]CAG5076384.1 Similar to abitram: Protein Abitram (Xenopus tropicalis) [Cotesia congregata]
MDDEKQDMEVEEEVDSGDDGFDFPPDDSVVNMLDEVDLSEELPCVTDRYFTPYYKIDAQKPNNDICIRIHSNRICMLSLAPSHPVLAKDSEIEKINFKVTEKLDRATNKVSGKAKHGAQPLQENSNICFITLANGETWPIKCCMIGKLVEINEALIDNPELIRKPPDRGGYLAIVLPNIKAHEGMKDKLLDEEGYKKAIAQREFNCNSNKNELNSDKKELNSEIKNELNFDKESINIKRDREEEEIPKREEKLQKC